jgi:hypothetical protein
MRPNGRRRSSISALAREVIAELAPLAAEKAVDLGLSEGGKAVVRGDAEALRTLLSNLIDNAVRYTVQRARRYHRATGRRSRRPRRARQRSRIAPAERAGTTGFIAASRRARRKPRNARASAAAVWGLRSSSASPIGTAPRSRWAKVSKARDSASRSASPPLRRKWTGACE